MPPKGRTPSNPPRRRPRVAGLHQPGRATQPTPPPVESTTEQWAAEQWTDEQWTDATANAPTTDLPTTDLRATADATADVDAPTTAHVDATAAPAADVTADAAAFPGAAATTEADPTAATRAEPDVPVTIATTAATRPAPSSPRTMSRGEPPAGRDRRRLAGVPLVVVLLLVALVAGAAGAFFRGQAARASTGSADNLAIVDTAATGEVVGQVSKAIETVLSYDHTKLDENERAGREVITGRYADEFGTTFADVRESAPEQKLVLTTTVLLAGVTSISGDRAEVIATMDLAAIRDGKPYNSPGRVKVVATKVDGRWKIAEMTLL